MPAGEPPKASAGFSGAASQYAARGAARLAAGRDPAGSASVAVYGCVRRSSGGAYPSRGFPGLAAESAPDPEGTPVAAPIGVPRSPGKHAGEGPSLSGTAGARYN